MADVYAIREDKGLELIFKETGTAYEYSGDSQ